MKKFFALVLALVMALSLTTVAWGAGVTTEQQLKDAVAAGGVVELDGDIVLTSAIPVTQDVTINGNGHKLSINAVGRVVFFNNTSALGNDGIAADLTVYDVVFENATGVDGGYVTIVGPADNGDISVTLDGCTLKNLYCGVYGGNVAPTSVNTIRIYDCEYDNTDWGLSVNSEALGNTGNYGVAFVGNTGLTGAAATDPVEWGFDAVAANGDVGYKKLSAAVDAAETGDTVTLLEDNAEAVVLPDGVALNPAGYDHAVTAANGQQLMQTTNGTLVSSAVVTYGDKFDLYLADKTMNAMLALEKPAVSGLTFDEKGAKTNTDGTGNVAYIAANNGDYYVKTTTPTTESYAVTAHGKTTVLYYVDVVDTASANVFYYTAAVKEFTNFGLKCGQLYVTPTATQTFFQTVTGIVYLADDASTDISMNYLLDGEVVGVDPLFVTVANQQFVHYGRFPIDHTFAVTNYQYDSVKKVNVPTEATCTTCLLKTTNIYKDGKVPATYSEYPLNAAGYVVGLAPNTVIPGTVVVPSTPSTDKVTSADTFDAGIAMYVGMSVMAAAGSVVVLKKKD